MANCALFGDALYTCDVTKTHFSSVQFKMVSMRSEMPICAPPRLSEVSPTLPLKRFQCLSDWRWPSLVLSRKIVLRLLFPHLSPPDDRWCDALGFVLAGSVSSFSILQIFREASQLRGLLCPPVYLLDHFPLLQHVQGNRPAGVLEGECRPSAHFSLGFPFLYSLFVATSWNLWGWRHVRSDCHLLRQSSGGHGWLSDMGDISVKKVNCLVVPSAEHQNNETANKSR